jgi:hypothetical protein
MKPIINPMRFTLALTALWGFGLTAAWASDGLFAVVPTGDATYAKLGQLEQAGLLSPGQSQGPLTRFEVAQLITKARNQFHEIVVAQADEIPPPPDSGAPPSSSPAPSTAPPPPPDNTAAPPPPPSDNTAAPPPPPATGTAAPETPAPAVAAQPPSPTATPEDPLKWSKIAQTLSSLEDAYQYELKDIQTPVKELTDKTQALENGQYDLLKRLKGIDEYPTIAWHGLGRVFGAAQRYTSSDPGLSLPVNDNMQGRGYIDFEPEGVISKQIRWELIVRYGTAMVENDSQAIDSFLPRRGTMELKAPWFTATLGDFDESYTPLTLWNRDNLDLRWVPEMIAREDDTLKYESFMNNEPNWPFRGLRLGTEVAWPESTWLDHFTLSLMADMLRNGYNDLASGGSYIGTGFFTDWLFAGKGQLATKRLYLGGGSNLKLAFDAYGLWLVEPFNILNGVTYTGTETPGSPYSSVGASTWAHQYQILSLKPSVEITLGDGVVLGGYWETATSLYEDDAENSATDTTDWAVLAGPYLKFEHSQITFNYLNVGPNYYSPMAQTRQDILTTSTAFNPASGLPTPELFSAPLRSQFFLPGVPRAGGIYSFYDRTSDNTFPYGLATPNRQGGGVDLDIKTLEKDSLQIKGSVYFVQEIQGNLVADSQGTGFVPVDAVTVNGAQAAEPIRNFTYVNLGPSFNLGPSIDDPEKLVIGTNVRYEETDSSIGTLTSTWVLGGIEAGLFSWWEMALSFGADSVSGSEAGYMMNGQVTTLARYSYMFDNTDLGQYQVFNINGTNDSFRLSTSFTLNRNSKLYLDYDSTWGNAVPYFGTTPPTGTLNNQFAELTYEIQF